jgi:hypothetical protein
MVGPPVPLDRVQEMWYPWHLTSSFLEAACPNHMYPIKHKLKDCTMMKNFMTLGALSMGKKQDGEPGGKCAASFQGLVP